MPEQVKTILLIHGPNLNLLGRRAPQHYGRLTLAELEDYVKVAVEQAGYTLLCFQSNSEGQLIDFIHRNLDLASGALINAGAYAHYSYALRDALEICEFPIVEVHLSNIYEREDFRARSVLTDVCIGQVVGLGKEGYLKALDLLWQNLAGKV